MKLLNALPTLLMAFVALVAIGTASHTHAQDYRIQPGDTLRVEVIEDSSINRDVLVAPDGRISVPLAGVVRVGGATIPEAQRRVVDALEENFATAPTVLVSLLQLNREDAEEESDVISIFVIGEVRNPGRLAAENGTTLLQSLAIAGGVTDFAATKRIQLRRQNSASGSETIYNFNYDQVIDGIAGIGTAELSEGDIIVVPARRLFE